MYDRFFAVHILEAEVVPVDLNKIDILQVFVTVFVVEDKR
jgi:hypothetical protein